MHQPQRIGDKLVHRDDHGGYVEVDATAVPSHDETGTDRWKYSLGNAGEHFAEMYAMAVETPDLLYADYVERPAARVRLAQQGLADARRTGQQKQIDAATAELASAKKVQEQRKALFDIIRDEVFKANTSVAAAVGRLRRHGLDDTALRAFQDKAARVSTPAQIADLERETMR